MYRHILMTKVFLTIDKGQCVFFADLVYSIYHVISSVMGTIVADLSLGATS